MDEPQNELHTVEVRFLGEMLATYLDLSGAYTLYRTPEGLYLVYIDEDDGEGGLAWLEAGRTGSGLTEEQIWREFPEFHAALTGPGRGSAQAPSSTACTCCR